ARRRLREAGVRERHQLLELDVAADARVDHPGGAPRQLEVPLDELARALRLLHGGERYRKPAVADTVRAWASSPGSATRSSAPSPPLSRSARCARGGRSPRARSTPTSPSRPSAAAGSSAS